MLQGRYRCYKDACGRAWRREGVERKVGRVEKGKRWEQRDKTERYDQ